MNSNRSPVEILADGRNDGFSFVVKTLNVNLLWNQRASGLWIVWNILLVGIR
jgi:hypothetical protein